jgi:hypothetical protein
MTTRRVFISAGEVPHLLAGAVLGRSVALRRLLGARRAGRYGLGAALICAVAALPSELLPLALIAHLAASAIGMLLANSEADLRVMEYQRLSLWVLAPVLAGLALLRLLGEAAALTSCTAVGFAHLLLWRGLRGGLDDG